MSSESGISKTRWRDGGRKLSREGMPVGAIAGDDDQGPSECSDPALLCSARSEGMAGTGNGGRPIARDAGPSAGDDARPIAGDDATRRSAGPATLEGRELLWTRELSVAQPSGSDSFNARQQLMSNRSCRIQEGL